MLEGNEHGVLRSGSELSFPSPLTTPPFLPPSLPLLGSDSKAVLKATMDIAQANFPEMLFKNHIVNAPWIFNTIVRSPIPPLLYPSPSHALTPFSVPPLSPVVFCERIA
jgi:hypothetical protein